MEEKITAVYLMVRQSELGPEDRGNYERLIGLQKRKCIDFLRQKGLGEGPGTVFYTKRSDLFIDIERDKVARLLVHDTARLGAIPEEVEGILFELQMRGVELLTVEGDK